MSDNDPELSPETEAALKQAAKAWGEDGRVAVPPAARLAQLKAAALNKPDSANRISIDFEQPSPISKLPAAAVAVFVAGMMGFVLLWSQGGKAPAAKVPSPVVAAPDPSRPDSAPREDQPEQPDEKKQEGAVFTTTMDLAKGAAVHLENMSGEVNISEIDGEKVTIRATKRVGNASGVTIIVDGKKLTPPKENDPEALKKLTIETRREPNGDIAIRTVDKGVNANGATIVFSAGNNSMSTPSVDYEIGVPRYARIGRIKQSHGDITLTGANGDPQLDTTTGSVRVTDTRGTVSAQSSHGDIAITGATAAARLLATTGSIRVNNCKRVESASTAHGSIEFTGVGVAGPMKTTTGNIRIRQCGGAIDARTSHGNIDAEGTESVQRLDATTGNISADVTSLAGGSAQISSSHGSIRLRLSPGLNATVKAETSMGSARSTVKGLDPVKKRDFDMGSSIRGKLGDGAGTLTISATTGDITLSPLP